MMNDIDQIAYDNYFGKDVTSLDIPINKQNASTAKEDYTYNQFIPNADKPITTKDIPNTDIDRFVAEGNISDIDQLGELLRLILNAAWGLEWGSISPELKKGESSEDVLLPQITFDINMRESAEGFPIKPKLYGTTHEVVNGVDTGDIFNVYRQWFDLIVEFNFWGRTNLEARQIMNKFEAVMGAYAGHLKKQGVSEVFFLKELSPSQSAKFVEGSPMRCLMYFVRLERIQTVRESELRNIDMTLNTPKDVIKTTVKSVQLSTGNNNTPDNIYESSKNNYNL